MQVARRNLLALSASAAASLCLPARAAAAGTIRMAFPVPIGTLDPASFRTGGLEHNYACYVFNRLVANDAKLQVQPELATHWQASADLKTWDFHLRPGVRFHNGKLFDASDVIYTIKRLQDAQVASPMRVKIGMVVHVEAPDPMTVRFTLSIPYADLPAVLSRYEAMILTPTADATLTTHPIGTGPFRFIEYRPGDVMKLSRNPDYFQAGLPRIEAAELRIIPDFTIAVAALQSGEVDVVFDLPPEQIDVLAHSDVAGVQEITSGFWQGFVMNTSLKPFDDPRVRAAFIKIVDKPAFTDIATFGHGTPTASAIPPDSPFYRADIKLGADIAGARALLAEAGYASGLAVDMYVPGNSPSMERLATAFRDAAKQAGVDVSLIVMPQDKFFAELEGKVALNVDQFLGAITPDLILYDMYHSGGAWNDGLWHYHNPQVDALLDEARATTDVKRQAQLYGRFQEITCKDGPGIVVYVQSLACGVANRLHDFAVTPLQLADISKVTIAA